MKVFVYGSLKKGFYNDHILKDSEFIGTEVVHGYSMSSLGAYPMAYNDPEGQIVGELYYITPETLERLDMLESEGKYYDRLVVNGVTNSNFFMYVGVQAYQSRIDKTNPITFWQQPAKQGVLY